MTSETGQEAEAWQRVEAVHAEFPDLPKEVVFKEDLLRLGMSFSPEAFRAVHDYARKSYFIFSFDHSPLADLDQESKASAPEEIRFFGGPTDLEPTIVSVRLNPASPYRIDRRVDDPESGTGCVLTLDGVDFAEVEFAPTPPYYGGQTADGTPLTETAPSIEWGYLLYLTVFRMCQYFGRDEECQFCDINHNFRQQRQEDRIYNAIKPLDRMLEALAIIADSDSRAQAYTLTGGSITSKLQDQGEADYYLKYAEAIEQKFPGKWLGKMVVQALPVDDVKRIRDAGIEIYHPNYEIWDPELFAKICPGKSRYVGRDEWISRIIQAKDVFPAYSVIPNFVAGIEMARPFGFKTEEEAWSSTSEGLDFFMSQGVIPRFTTWCPEPMSVLGEQNAGPASLRYHVGLLRTWRGVHEKYNLPAPRGYGEPGLGKAVFSVSSFMDVIREAGSASSEMLR